MADNVPAAAPQQTGSEAQNQQYENPQGNGQTNPSHMPPPPRPPVVIPQNTNPIPTAITSPMSGAMMSPTSAGGYVRRAAPEPNKRALYVGGLDPRVTEDILKQIFETTGHVVSVKIIPDKNVSHQETSTRPGRFENGSIHPGNVHTPSQSLEFLSQGPRADLSPQFNSKGYNYGFVEFDDPGAAERAMQTLNGRRIHQSVSLIHVQ